MSFEEQERRVVQGLKALAAESRRTQAPARVERQLLQAFRKEMGVAPPPRLAFLRPALAWGMAVAATVALALVLLHSRQPHQTVSHPGTGREMAALETPADATPVLTENGFIPLPNAEQIDPDDEVDVVRMELPRDALIAMGLPVSDDQPAAVEADVALGGDGVARAVRFLD
jgi:hypothetical protein